MPTPHIACDVSDIARTVLMPGDPRRSEFIAKTFLDDARLVNDIRCVHGYTGSYRGHPVTVMASGMGMPAIGIYSWELYKFYDVENIIRLGTAGSYVSELRLFDLLLANASWSDSSFARVQSGDTADIQLPSEDLNYRLRASAKTLGVNLHEGLLHSSDVFYATNGDYVTSATAHGCCAVEMESFALFHNARLLGKKAACLLTISNSFVSEEEATPKQRESGLTDMIRVALGALQCESGLTDMIRVALGALQCESGLTDMIRVALGALQSHRPREL